MHIKVQGVLHDLAIVDGQRVVTAKGGFHLNTTEQLEGLDDYLVTPKTPRLVFMGYPTYHYCFESEEQARELVPDAFPSETLEDE